MYRDHNCAVQNSCGHQCPPIKKQEKGLEDFANIWRPYNSNMPQILGPDGRVIFTEDKIIGDSITHGDDATDIGLEACGSYLVQYTVTVSSTVDAGTSRRIIFSLVYESGMAVPGTTQATTVEPTREFNVVSSSIIINTKDEDRIIRLVAEAIPVGLIAVIAATITVVKIR